MIAILRTMLLTLLLASSAWAGNVTLVLTESSGPYAEFDNTLRSVLDGNNWKLSTHNASNLPETFTPRPELIVTAGTAAFRQILSRGGQTPIIATLIPRQAYDKALADHNLRSSGRISAIYLDQPPARQAAFLRHLLPDQKKIGMLLSQETLPTLAGFRQAFSKAGLNIETEESETERSLLPSLNSLLSRVGVLLATPDTQIYRRDNIKAILVTTYRYQRPVIAFSSAFVNAGALAALFSTPAQIARQTAELIQQFSTTLPAPSAPAQFAIAINPNVAQALDLQLPDEATIRRAMLAERESR